METNQPPQPVSQNKSISYIKFLVSLLLLKLAYNALAGISDTGSARGMAVILWGVIFLIWGVLWFLQLPSLRSKLSLQKVLENTKFKKVIKWLVILLAIFAIFLTIIGAFDGFIPGLSGKDFFTIMLAPILH